MKTALWWQTWNWIHKKSQIRWHIKFQLCHQKAVFKGQYTFCIYGHLIQRATFGCENMKEKVPGGVFFQCFSMINYQVSLQGKWLVVLGGFCPVQSAVWLNIGSIRADGGTPRDVEHWTKYFQFHSYQTFWPCSTIKTLTVIRKKLFDVIVCIYM